MDRALLLLLRLRLKSWGRRLRRSLGTVKGALLVGFGTLMLAVWLLPTLLMTRPAPDPNTMEHARNFGGLILLLYCVLNVLFSSAERGVVFSAAEVDLLFPAPFSRRQLLGYKILSNFAILLLTAVFFLLMIRLPLRLPLAGYVALLLALFFVQLFGLAVSLLANVVGVRAYSRWRKLVLAVPLALVLVVLWRTGADLGRVRPERLLELIEETPALKATLAPFNAFVEAYLAERYWPDFATALAKCLAVDGVLLLLVFMLDAQFLEASAATSAKVYALRQRMRSGGGAAVALRSSGKPPRLRVPMLPWWGGVGPVAWRQLTTALRSRGPLILAIVLGVGLVGPVIASSSEDGTNAAPPMYGAASAMTILLTALVAYDFRGDIDRMDVLKSLPVRPAGLVIGQLTTPVMLMTALQWTCLAALAFMQRSVGPVHAAVALLAVPFNYYLFGLENLLFLLFPTRVMAAGDFQAAGRNVLLLLAKLLGFGVAGGLTAAAAVPVYFLTDSLTAALLAACVVLGGCAAGLVPLVALAFRAYDVTRDTPP